MYSHTWWLSLRHSKKKNVKWALNWQDNVSLDWMHCKKKCRGSESRLVCVYAIFARTWNAEQYWKRTQGCGKKSSTEHWKSSSSLGNSVFGRTRQLSAVSPWLPFIRICREKEQKQFARVCVCVCVWEVLFALKHLPYITTQVVVNTGFVVLLCHPVFRCLSFRPSLFSAICHILFAIADSHFFICLWSLVLFLGHQADIPRLCFARKLQQWVIIFGRLAPVGLVKSSPTAFITNVAREYGAPAIIANHADPLFGAPHLGHRPIDPIRTLSNPAMAGSPSHQSAHPFAHTKELRS